MVVETITTKDGKFHTLLGSTTLESIVREYAGDEAANEVRRLAEQNVYEEYRAETDLGAFEASLEHWRSTAQDWLNDINSVLTSATQNPKKHTRASLLIILQKLAQDISNEL